MIYDEFQKKAIQCAERNSSVIVCAPTGAGKTAIAEYIIEKCIAEKKGVVYTAPIKALSNQKFRDFTHVYGQNIGILTGDVSLNPQAPVLIMTTEIFRNTLLEDDQRLNNISWVIFDEVHYIDDWERGTVWEESIIFCPPHIRILALSATIPNAIQIASWIKNIQKHPVETIIEKQRPVPLRHIFQANNRIFFNIEQLKKNTYLPEKKRHSRNFQDKKNRFRANRIDALLSHLQQTHKLPAIYFAFSRKRCEELAFETKYFDFLDNEEREKITDLFKKLLQKFGLEHEPSALRLWPLVSHGIAYHHAGILPSIKEVIEQLFTSRLIKLIFTTETFALGINMPARTVIFDELRKFYGYNYAFLRCRDYYQMAGRAGRRGIDTEGFVYSRINPHRIPIEQIKKTIFGQPEPVNSQFNLSYATLLHLYEKWQEQLYEIYPLTLHFYQSSKRSRKNALAALRTKITFLKEMNYIAADRLTYKGSFASNIYGYELPLTELFSRGVLEQFSSIELAIVLVCLVFEPRKSQMHAKIDANALKISKIIYPIIDDVLKKEKKHRIYPLSKKPYFNLGQAIERWAYGDDFSQIKSIAGADEGEIVRYFRMVIQILRQLHAIPVISAAFKYKIHEALSLINRGEIDAEKQLREGL
ncbi:MAG: DEAD/DEAH box helicase [Candidatus Omnitrophica bacterium]|nr:DEAD/DEAH box helicase [Candidatus Omnitrophota bacterium]MBU4478313.1 DEAD/DEAH box helicase [Candidatus Omnitrophota bacterium]